MLLMMNKITIMMIGIECSEKVYYNAHLLFVLVGCRSEGHALHNVTIKEKITENENCTRCYHNPHIIMVEKNGTVVKMKASKLIYDLLEEGSVVDITYNDKYALIGVSFPKMEEE